MASTLPTFSDLKPQVAPHPPSEVHGLLCGLACGDEPDYRDWRGQLLCAPDADGVLEQLFGTTCQQLLDAELGFHLLLPTDEAPLRVRTPALGAWCRGFISGLGQAMLASDALARWPSHWREVLNDLDKIAQLGRENSEPDTEEDEVAYAELVEHVRLCVLLMRQNRTDADPA